MMDEIAHLVKCFNKMQHIPIYLNESDHLDEITKNER
jgi:hypothetical protein